MMIPIPFFSAVLSALTIFYTIMAFIFSHNYIVYMFSSLMSVFMYFIDFESFAPLERYCDFAKFWFGKKTNTNWWLFVTYVCVGVLKPEDKLR